LEITFDPAKREQTMRERGLDFARADELFAGPAISFEDVRRNYGEVRMVTVGLLDDRITIVVWTQGGSERRIISMRHCNEREQRRFEAFVARR
jgi:uncharacterized DUF497 family protein